MRLARRVAVPAVWRRGGVALAQTWAPFLATPAPAPREIVANVETHELGQLDDSWSAIDAVQHVEQGEPFERLLVNLLQVNTRILRVGSFNKVDFWSVVFDRLHAHTKEGQAKARVAARGAGPKEKRRQRIQWLSKQIPRMLVASASAAATGALDSSEVPRFASLAHGSLDTMRATAVKATPQHWAKLISTAAELVMAACPDGAAPDHDALPQLAETLASLLTRLDKDIAAGVADCVRSADLGPAILALALAGDARARHVLVMAVKMDALQTIRAAVRRRSSKRTDDDMDDHKAKNKEEEHVTVGGLEMPRGATSDGMEALLRNVPLSVSVKPGPALWAGLAKGLAVRGRVDELQGLIRVMQAGQSVTLEALGATPELLFAVIGCGGYSTAEIRPSDIAVEISPRNVQSVIWGHYVRALCVAGDWEEADRVVHAVRNRTTLDSAGTTPERGDTAETSTTAGKEEEKHAWKPIGDAEELRELQLEVMVGQRQFRRARETFDAWLQQAVADQQLHEPLLAHDYQTAASPALSGIQAVGVTGRMWHQRLRAASSPADAEAVLANLASGVGERAGRRHRLWPGVWAALLDVHTDKACKAGAASVLGRMTQGIIQWGPSDVKLAFRAGGVAWARAGDVLAPFGPEAIRTQPLEASKSFKRRAFGAAKRKQWNRRGKRT